MPYRRRRRRRYYRKKKGASYATYLKYGIGAYKLAKAILPYLPFNAEYKRHSSTTGGPISTTATTLLLPQMAQGVNYDERVGLSARITSIQAKAFFTINASATTTQIRQIIWCARHPEGANPNVDDFYTPSFGLTAMRAQQHIRDIVVVSDRFFTLSANGAHTKQFNFFKKLPSRSKISHIRYSGTGSTIASIDDNAWYVTWISNEPTNTPSLNWRHTIRYLDN